MTSLATKIKHIQPKRLREQLQKVTANYDQQPNDQQRTIFDNGIKAINEWARMAYRARLFFSIITLGVYPLIHLIVAAIGRFIKPESYRAIPLDCTQVPVHQAEALKQSFHAEKLKLDTQPVQNTSIEDTDEQSSHLADESQEMVTELSPFYTLIKDLDDFSDGTIMMRMLEYLDPATLQHLGKTAHIAGQRASQNNNGDDWSWSPRLVDACRTEYLKQKAPEHASMLRDHVMNWEYDKAKALATKNPVALMIPCQYKNNRWQGDEHSVNESALEHAWRTGDENFIVLFEELGKDLPRRAFTHRDKLLADSQTGRNTIADALNQYVNDADVNALYPIWLNAPHWVLGLDYLIWDKNIEDAAKIDIFSSDFRSAAGRFGAVGPYRHFHAHALPSCEIVCLSVKVSTARRSTEQRPLIFNG